MRILALDSAMTGCSACVYDAGVGILAQKSVDVSRGQAELLMPLINEVIEDASIDYESLDMVAVTKGPGAFTGMRIGLATARAIGMTLNKPVTGVCCFEAILYSYFHGNGEQKNYPNYAVILETKRNDYYVQMFSGDTQIACSQPATISSDEIVSLVGDKDCLFVGDAITRFEKESGMRVKGKDIYAAYPQVIAELAVNSFKSDQGLQNSLPVYLRGPEIGVPKKQARSIK